MRHNQSYLGYAILSICLSTNANVFQRFQPSIGDIYILIGIGIGATMHGYVPEGFFENYLSSENWWGVPLAVLIAVPMYANAAGIVPIVEVFVAKGIPLGTAIAFMMAIIGLSIPEATMLKKVMTWRLIGIFFGVVSLLIIISGYLFNWIL
jgi:uncharacterized membrane protein YraQ (UPF0718 family)